MEEKIILKAGSIYEGDLENGEPNGKGRKTYPEGRTEKGEWKDGEFTGKDRTY